MCTFHAAPPDVAMDSINITQSKLSLTTKIAWQTSGNATSYDTKVMCNDNSFMKSGSVLSGNELEYEVQFVPQMVNCTFSVTPKNSNGTGNTTAKNFTRIGKFILSVGVQTYFPQFLNSSIS